MMRKLIEKKVIKLGWRDASDPMKINRVFELTVDLDDDTIDFRITDYDVKTGASIDFILMGPRSAKIAYQMLKRYFEGKKEE